MPSPAQPGQSSPPSMRLLTPLLASDRAPSSTQALVLVSMQGRAPEGADRPTSYESRRLRPPEEHGRSPSEFDEVLAKDR